MFASARHCIVSALSTPIKQYYKMFDAKQVHLNDNYFLSLLIRTALNNIKRTLARPMEHSAASSLLIPIGETGTVRIHSRTVIG